MQAETLSANVCVPFPLLGRFLCSQLHGTATDSDAKQCQKVPSKLVEEENAGGGVRREKRSAVKYETRFAEFEDEKASHVQGIFQGQAAAKIRVWG